MKRNHLYLLVVVIAFVVSLFVYIKMERYTIVGAGEGKAFQLDRLTGETWFLIGGRRRKMTDE